ncbi:MAG TPA: hypothetical protein VK633_00355 [Verrucomicrobiae bacterium]|nr:hypothetical protein [Verrucomicrobiae bacterium]
MKRRLQLGSWLMVLAIGVSAGCGKKPEAESAAGTAAEMPVEAKAKRGGEPAGRELIPGENEVKGALAKKDYSGAVQRYMAMKGAVATPEQNEEYAALYGQVRTELEDASRTDPKAAEALGMFRAMRNGR